MCLYVEVNVSDFRKIRRHRRYRGSTGDNMGSFLVLSVIFGFVSSASVRIYPDYLPPAQLLTLPSNATSIRSDISDSFSCEGRDYGYYADVDNDCQLFHVCLPMRYADGRSHTFRWTFICPEETIFNQEMFTCTRSDESIDCAQSPTFYDLNRNFGSEEETSGLDNSPSSLAPVSSIRPNHPYGPDNAEMAMPESDIEAPAISEVSQAIGRSFNKKSGKNVAKY